MKKTPAYILFYGAAVLMIIGFFIHLAVDYVRYGTTLNSAPFWVWFVVDALIWLLPAALAFVVGFIAKKRLCKKEKTQ